ncbi:hypothetical protein IFM89_004701, partial [Coptis chinensis]
VDLSCVGGAERLIVDAAVELTSQGHNVHIFTSHHDKTRCFEETLDGTFPVTVYGSFLPRHIIYRFHAICAYLRCIFVALCVLLRWRASFDVVLADQVSIVIPFIKTMKSTKVIFYCHFPDLLLAQHSTALRRIYRKPIDMLEEATTGMADLILVNSRFTASTFANTFKLLNSRGIQPAILYPAVNVEQFDESTSYKNFLSINRFERKKNIELAISSFSILHSLQDVSEGQYLAGASLTIAGGFDKRLRENVDYLEELKSLAEREGVSDRVNFITSCSTAERNALLSQCLCVLYTPKDEHFGIVPLEAMAAQKPVIACNSGGPVETVKDGVTGFLCDPTPQDFSLAMAKLIKDPSVVDKMGREARQHVSESFSTKVFGQRLNQYLIDVVRGKIFLDCRGSKVSKFLRKKIENDGLRERMMSENTLNRVGVGENETVIEVRTLVNGIDEGVSKSKENNVLEISNVVVEKVKNESSGEEKKHVCVIDVKCDCEKENWDAEKVCRICHLTSDFPSESSDLIQLGCGCKGELGIAHRHCAEAWFKLRGNRCCEICSQAATNITGVGDSRFMQEWNEGSDVNSGNLGARRGYLRGQPFCNFLMACLVIAFVLPWFFRVNIF